MNTAPTENSGPEEASTPAVGSLHWTEAAVIDVTAEGSAALVLADTKVFSAQRDVLHLGHSEQTHLQEFSRQQVVEAEAALTRNPGNFGLTKNLAAAQLLSGRPDLAISTLAPYAGDQDTSVMQLIARAKCEAGEFEDSIRLYRAALEREPSNTQLLLEYAGALFGVGDLEGSRAAYERALSLDPDNAWASNNLGILQATSSEARNAVRSFRRAVRGHDRFAVAYNNLGLCLAKLGEIDKAIHHFRTALRLVPSYRGAYFNLVHALIRSEQYEEAESVLRRARRQFPDDPSLGDLLTDVLSRQRKWNQAATVFRELLSRFEKTYTRLNNVGVALLHLGKEPEAEAAWRTAAMAPHVEHHAYQNLLNLLRRTLRYAEAQAVFATAMSVLPADDAGTAEVEVAFAVSLMEQGKLAEAEAILRNRVAKGPLTASTVLALNNLLGEYLGRYEDAAALVRDAMREFPDEVRFGNSLAYDLLMSGDVSGANQLLQRYAKYTGVEPHFTATWGLYYLRRGNLEKGIEHYREAISVAPHSLKRRVRQKLELELGRTFLQTSQPKLAKQHLKRAIELNAHPQFTRQARLLLAAPPIRESLI